VDFIAIEVDFIAIGPESPVQNAVVDRALVPQAPPTTCRARKQDKPDLDSLCNELKDNIPSKKR